jgi:hypothetical protein
MLKRVIKILTGQTVADNKPFAGHPYRRTVKTALTILRHKSISIRLLKSMKWVGVSKTDFQDAFANWLFLTGGARRALVCPLGIASSTQCQFIRTPHRWQTQCATLLTQAAKNVRKMQYYTI